MRKIKKGILILAAASLRPAFLISLAIALAGCAGVHGNVNAGVTGSVFNPGDAQFQVGGQINFAKKPKVATGAKDPKDR